MTEETGFILTDRNDSSGADGSEKGKKSASSESGRDRQAATFLPAIDFSTFIMSLNASALVSLGVIADPVTGLTSRQLPLGKQTIDIIAMLEDKTRGNLTSDEEKLLRSMLYDLRITYVTQSG